MKRVRLRPSLPPDPLGERAADALGLALPLLLFILCTLAFALAS